MLRSVSLSCHESFEPLLSRPNGLLRLLKLFRPSELEYATLPVREMRVPGSVVMIPNPESDCSSAASCEDENELVDRCFIGERSWPKLVLSLGERGDRGELGVGAGAMRTTGAKAASSGCK